jgi:hypothetical protein
LRSPALARFDSGQTPLTGIAGPPRMFSRLDVKDIKMLKGIPTFT